MIPAAPPPGAPSPAPEYSGGFTRSHNLQNTSARVANWVAVVFCYASALFAITALFLIFGYVAYKGIASMDIALFRELPPHGLRNCIAGTLVLIGMASCLGVPMGMLCGIYLAEYAGESYFSNFIRLVVDVLAGVPSILVGVLGYELVVVPMGGNSAWAGALALGVMMCPIIARTTEEMLKLVPKALREASTGLGGSKFQTLFRIVVPAASSGIITGIMLAVARVAGETAPLLFTALGSDLPVFAFNWRFPFLHADLNRAFPSLTVKIYQYANSPEPDLLKQLWAAMLILIALILVLNVCVRVISARKQMAMK